MNTEIHWWRVGVLFVAMAGMVSIAFVAGRKTVVENGSKQPVSQAVKANNNTTTELLASESMVSPSYTDPVIEWYAEPKRVQNFKLFRGDNVPEMKTQEIGAIRTGDERGGLVYSVVVAAEGPGGNSLYYFLKRKNGELAFIKEYSSDNFFEMYTYDQEEFSEINRTLFPSKSYSYITLVSLNYPRRLVNGEGKVLMLDDEFPGSYGDVHQAYTFDVAYLKPVFRDPYYGEIYTTDIEKAKGVDMAGASVTNKDLLGNGYYVRAPDGTYRAYTTDFSILGNDDVLAITWNDGSINASKYSGRQMSGCGVGGYADVSTEKEANLRVVGKTKSGDSVYEYADSNHPDLKDWYNGNMKLVQGEGETSLFSRSAGPGDEYALRFHKNTTYEEFVLKHPYIFWKDIFGRLIRFENLDFILGGGCGKPVIYLYPKEKTDVSVQVLLDGGMTVSDPAYVNGWNVTAFPDGRLINRADDKIYPYLFWEGSKKKNYQMPEKGFSVANSDLETFFDQKLHEAGLTDRETNDFKAFWVPKMRSENKSYYFVTFVPRNDIDRLAPLMIEPHPDTTLRVWMDYRGLDTPVVVEGLSFSPPKRIGFIAVEWGGILR